MRSSDMAVERSPGHPIVIPSCPSNAMQPKTLESSIPFPPSRLFSAHTPFPWIPDPEPLGPENSSRADQGKTAEQRGKAAVQVCWQRADQAVKSQVKGTVVGWLDISREALPQAHYFQQLLLGLSTLLIKIGPATGCWNQGSASMWEKADQTHKAQSPRAADHQQELEKWPTKNAGRGTRDMGCRSEERSKAKQSREQRRASTFHIFSPGDLETWTGPAHVLSDMPLFGRRGPSHLAGLR
ncbi:hypothetical protein CMEL01_07020 [Colletotrichum melonis]|uniref:Uncharacterized protein n=1 Tax=Colletotrichum melonis TaxID=1209925 RepID=A0AAI9XGY8_9PEZI|nr:hypothetical protein CMEL01_07020 [Colletotrichum melonis]